MYIRTYCIFFLILHCHPYILNKSVFILDFLCILGTGKSETGAHIAYTLVMSNRIRRLDGCVLYCAPSNKAVDVVLSKFCKLY